MINYKVLENIQFSYSMEKKISCLICFYLNLACLGWHGNVEQRSRGVAMAAIAAPAVEHGMSR